VRNILINEGRTAVSPDDTPLFRMIAEQAEEQYAVPAGIQLLYRSTSDARFLRRRGIACYGLSPYPVNFFQSLTIHGADENISVWAFQEGVELLRAVVMRWAEAA
jgi:acetylornithine deacetylase/succinyl-diaminopimelate desuccinylase-like protein